MDVNEAKKIILSKYKDSEIVSIMKLRNGYLFSIKPKNWKDGDILLDPFFKVDNNGNLSEYSPVMDPEEFKEAMRNVIK